MNKRDEIREKALQDLQKHHVLMLDGHFDFGNGYHGRVYLNPHQLFRQPSTIWRFAQDLLDVLPASIAGPDRGRGRTGRPAARCSRTRWRACSTAAASCRARRRCSRRSRAEGVRRPRAQPFYARADHGPPRAARGRRAQHRPDAGALRRRWCARPAARWSPPRRSTIGMEAMVDAGVPNIALAEYKAPENHAAELMPAVPAPACRSRRSEPARRRVRAAERLDHRSTGRSTTSTRRSIPCTSCGGTPSREDREIVGFCAAALAFGRVASVLQSIEALLRVMGPRPAAFVRALRRRPRRRTRFEPLVHRWIRGRDLVALLLILQRMLREHGSIEALLPRRRRSGGARRARRARLVLDPRARDRPRGRLRPPAPARAGVAYFFPRPSARQRLQAAQPVPALDGAAATPSTWRCGRASRRRGWSCRSTRT